jgi:hypothetical protein
MRGGLMASQADDMLSVEPSTRQAKRASPRGGCNLRTSAHRRKIIWQACGVAHYFARHCELSEQRRTLGTIHLVGKKRQAFFCPQVFVIFAGPTQACSATAQVPDSSITLHPCETHDQNRKQSFVWDSFLYVNPKPLIPIS